MGSVCCKKLELPQSPKLPDFGQILLTCSDQIQICRKRLWDDEENEPKQRKFSTSDISYPLPLGCTILPPKRPPRKKKRILNRTTSVLMKNSRNRLEKLRRSKSIHEIRVYNVNPSRIQKEEPKLTESNSAPPEATRISQNVESDTVKNQRSVPINVKPVSDSDAQQSVEPPTTNEIILNVIAAAGGTTVPLDSPTEADEENDTEDDDERIYDTPYDDTNDFGTRFEVPTVALQPSQFYRQFDYSQSMLEPIIESAYESIESTTSNTSLVENKKHFLATLLEENNNNSNSNLPSRKSSITESLREFECSLYDMLEQEPAKDEVDDLKWRPQIPV